MNNKMILIGSLIVVALVGAYMLMSKPDAVTEQPVAAIEQPVVAPEVTQPVAQTEVQPEAKAEPVQPSLGASSSGLGR